MTDLEYIDALVSRVQEIRENSMASLYKPNFVLPEPILPEPMLIPHPHEEAPLQRSRIIMGSAGAAVTVVCLSLAVMMSLVHT